MIINVYVTVALIYKHILNAICFRNDLLSRMKRQKKNMEHMGPSQGSLFEKKRSGKNCDPDDDVYSPRSLSTSPLTVEPLY